MHVHVFKNKSSHKSLERIKAKMKCFGEGAASWRKRMTWR